MNLSIFSATRIWRRKECAASEKSIRSDVTDWGRAVARASADASLGPGGENMLDLRKFIRIPPPHGLQETQASGKSPAKCGLRPFERAFEN
jgi:hypothetical protein